MKEDGARRERCELKLLTATPESRIADLEDAADTFFQEVKLARCTFGLKSGTHLHNAVQAAVRVQVNGYRLIWNKQRRYVHVFPLALIKEVRNDSDRDYESV
jgi:hypothetical protein